MKTEREENRLEDIPNWSYVMLPDLQAYGVKTFNAGPFVCVLDALGHVHHVSRSALAIPLTGRMYQTMIKVGQARENRQEEVEAGKPVTGAALLQKAVEEADAGTGRTENES